MTHDTEGMRKSASDDSCGWRWRFCAKAVRPNDQTVSADVSAAIGTGRKRAVEIEPLVEAEVEVLARLGLIGEGRQVAEARRDREIGRERLVVGRVDILDAARESQPVDVDVGGVEEALELELALTDTRNGRSPTAPPRKDWRPGTFPSVCVPPELMACALESKLKGASPFSRNCGLAACCSAPGAVE